MREKVVPSRYGTNVSRWVSIFDVFDRAGRPTDPPRNPHERKNSETGPHVGTTRVGEGNRRPSHACRVRVWRLRAVSRGGSEKKTTISGRKRLIDFFNHLSTQYPRHHPFLGISARDPLCPNPRHATSKPNFTGSNTRAGSKTREAIRGNHCV